MNSTIREVLEFVEENDVKFIRLAFCDLFGVQKNISIMPEELPRAFEEGISFDASSIKGFSSVTESDLFLVPDATTLSVLPWRPQQGRVVRFFCSIKRPDGTIFSCDTRELLKRTLIRCQSMGYLCKVGLECEFYLFKTDEHGLPTSIPFDNGGYLDVSPLDKGENVRREVCLYLEEMGITPESSHHEQGPGQNEIDFRFDDALISADNLITFKSVVEIIAARSGLYASFLPKPISNKSGNGLHINLSLFKNGENIFKTTPEEHSLIAESFIAGILDKVPDMAAFLNPLENSYKRLGSFDAPKYVSWSHQNRSQLIRIPATTNKKNARMELRMADPSTNPYLALALIIQAGLDGIAQNLVLQPPVNEDLYLANGSITKNLTKLPGNLGDSLTLAQHSDFIRDTLGATILDKYIAYKEMEVQN